MKRCLLLGAAAAALALPLCAAASCGSAFCTINTNWDVQGAWQQPGARFDLRYEYIRQDQPMSGSRRIDVGEIPRHHDEVLTKNSNWLPSLDYTIDQDWGFNAQLPVVQREHHHIHNHLGGQEPESWDFTEVGDARIIARRRLASFEDAASVSSGSFGVNFGLKLPTGRTNLRNDEGELAERTLQPGTGTTDLLLGGYYSSQWPTKDLAWFAHALVQLPANSHDDFRPGRRLSLDTGIRYLANAKTSLMLQANVLFRGRDSGAQAEPEDSGGKALFLSPGIGYALTDALQVYAFLQLPLYQYVNGVQLTADRALAVGISSRF
jgi:hypothetical protein